jgi:hypothetical protein
MFTLNCPSCGKVLRLPDEAAGKLIYCFKCNAHIEVPSDPKDEVTDTPLVQNIWDTFEEDQLEE